MNNPSTSDQRPSNIISNPISNQIQSRSHQNHIESYQIPLTSIQNLTKSYQHPSDIPSTSDQHHIESYQILSSPIKIRVTPMIFLSSSYQIPNKHIISKSYHFLARAYRNLSKSLSTFYQQPIKYQNHDQAPVKILSRSYQDPIKILSRSYQDPIKIPSTTHQHPTINLSTSYHNPINIPSTSDQQHNETYQILSKSNQIKSNQHPINTYQNLINAWTRPSQRVSSKGCALQESNTPRE